MKRNFRVTTLDQRGHLVEGKVGSRMELAAAIPYLLDICRAWNAASYGAVITDTDHGIERAALLGPVGAQWRELAGGCNWL